MTKSQLLKKIPELFKLVAKDDQIAMLELETDVNPLVASIGTFVNQTVVYLEESTVTTVVNTEHEELGTIIVPYLELPQSCLEEIYEALSNYHLNWDKSIDINEY